MRIALLAFAFLCLFSARLAGAETLDVQSLAWMAGDWQMTSGKLQIEEHWTRPAGGTLLAVGRTLAGERMVFFEFLRIETRADGVFFVAQPKGAPPTDFKCVRLGDGEVVFENLKHDFPKRVIYRKGEGGALTARVEGDGSEKEKPQEFRYAPMK